MLEYDNRLGGAGGGTTAKDAIGNDVIAADWLNTHGPGDRTLTQGLKVQIVFVEIISFLNQSLTLHSYS